MGSNGRQLWRRKQQRKADGALCPAWCWSGLLRKTRRCIRRLEGLCRELVTHLPSKVSFREWVQRQDTKKELQTLPGQNYWGGVRKTKAHLQQRLAKGLKSSQTSATLVGKVGSLLSGVDECKSFNTAIILLLHIQDMIL